MCFLSEPGRGKNLSARMYEISPDFGIILRNNLILQDKSFISGSLPCIFFSKFLMSFRHPKLNFVIKHSIFCLTESFLVKYCKNGLIRQVRNKTSYLALNNAWLKLQINVMEVSKILKPWKCGGNSWQISKSGNFSCKNLVFTKKLSSELLFKNLSIVYTKHQYYCWSISFA